MNTKRKLNYVSFIFFCAFTFQQEYVFSFLLSCRFFIRTHELLGKFLAMVPDPEPLDRLVPLLAVWTKMFPYDFRDERMMNHVKHIVARYVSLCNNSSPVLYDTTRRIAAYSAF